MKLLHAFVTLVLLAMLYAAFVFGQLSGAAIYKNRMWKALSQKSQLYVFGSDGKGRTKSQVFTFGEDGEVSITIKGEVTTDEGKVPGELP